MHICRDKSKNKNGFYFTYQWIRCYIILTFLPVTFIQINIYLIANFHSYLYLMSKHAITQLLMKKMATKHLIDLFCL